MPAVKLCDGSSCRQRMFSFVREVVVPAATLHANTSAAYENQAYYCKDNHYEFN